MAQTTSKTISNGKNITIKLLPAVTQGIPVARRLMNVLAPIVGGTLDGMRHDELFHGAPKTFSDMALLVCKQLEGIDAPSLINTLLSGMEVDGKSVNIDEYFSANYGEMLEILEFALKENFSSFFTDSGMKARFLQVVGMISQGHIEGSSPKE